MEKQRLTHKTYKVLKALIAESDNKTRAVCIKDLCAGMGLNIHDAVYKLEELKCISVFKKDSLLHAHVLVGSDDLANFSTESKPRGAYDNFNAKNKKVKAPKQCPYKGRRYQDVARGTYDSAINCRDVPSRHREHSFGNASGMCTDA